MEAVGFSCSTDYRASSLWGDAPAEIGGPLLAADGQVRPSPYTGLSPPPPLPPMDLIPYHKCCFASSIEHRVYSV